MKKIIVMVALFAVAASTFNACKKSDDPGKAKLMVVHASPDAPGVDFLLDGTKQNSSALTFPNNTAYLSVNEGSRSLKVNVTGTTTTVIDANAAFTKDKNYSLFAIDSVSKISSLLIEDNLAAPASGKAHIRFIHLSPNAPNVDVAVTGGAVLFSNYAFKQAGAFTPVDAGTYNLEVRLAGTTTVVLALPGVVLTSGKIYTVFAKGFVGGAGSQALGAQTIINN